jgi:hypothetical protein
MNNCHQLYYFGLIFLLVLTSASYSQKVVLFGTLSKQYDSSSIIVLNSGDSISLTSQRMKRKSSLNNFNFKSDEAIFENTLISNKILKSENGDTLAKWIKSTIFFQRINETVEISRSRKGDQLNYKGWVFLSQTDTIASLLYKLCRDKNEYQLIATYNSSDIKSLLSLQMAIGRIDKRINLDYDSSEGIETFFSILLAGLLAN